MKLLTVAVLAALMTAVSLADELATKPLPEEAKAKFQAAYDQKWPHVTPSTPEGNAAAAWADLARACPTATTDKVAVGFAGYIFSKEAPTDYPAKCHIVRIADATHCIATIDGVYFQLGTFTESYRTAPTSDFPFRNGKLIMPGPMQKPYHIVDQTTTPDIGDGKTPVWVADEIDTRPFYEAKNVQRAK